MKLIDFWKGESSSKFKRKIIKAVIGFFVLMLAFTVISRAAFSVTAVQVKTAAPEQEKIVHEISGSGELKGKQELAVSVVEGLGIQKVCVSEGEAVTKGRTLLVLKQSDLSYAIAACRAELEPKKEDSQLPETEDNTVTKKQKQEQLQELLNLQANGGRVCAPEKGLITEVGVKAGDKTTGGGDVRYADASDGLLLTASFSKDDRDYLKKSGKVTVEGENGKSVPKLKVKSITADKEDPDAFLVTAEVPGKSFNIGSMAEMKVESADKAYDHCVPREAVHQSENGTYYVYTIKESESVLGPRLEAMQTDVTISDQNESSAAIDGLEEGQEVIVEASKELEDQCRVRRLE